MRRLPNTAMHLSRRRNVIFFAEHTLRPGDGERSKDRRDPVKDLQLRIIYLCKED